MKAGKKNQITGDVTETVHSTAAHKVDREAGIIHGVKILGPKSRNGYEYTAEALRKAAPLYVGRPVNLNHGGKPGAERSIESRFGKIIAAESRDDGIYGDLQYNRKHPLADMIAEAAAEMPDTFGLSQIAKVKWRTPARLVAESILQVNSVDVVANPATTSGVFEHQEPTVTTFKTVRESLSAGSKVRKLFDLICEEGMGMGDMPLPEAPAATDPDQALKDGFKSAMMAAVDAFVNGDTDAAAMVAKLKELAKMLEKANSAGEAPAEPPAEEPAAESKKPEKPVADPTITTLQEEVRTLRRENLLHRVCAAEKFEPSAVLLKHLNRCESEAEMRELIQESKGKAAEGDGHKPPPSRVKSGLQTTVTESAKTPTTQEEFNRACFGRN